MILSRERSIGVCASVHSPESSCEKTRKMLSAVSNPTADFNADLLPL